MEKGREKLEKYFAEGKYVFHGTHDGQIVGFEPRQAYNYDENGNKYKDGEPAVFASELIDIPIFFALFNHEVINPEGTSSFGTGFRDGKVTLRATKNKINYFKNNKVEGYVYVFDKEKFYKREGAAHEMTCEEKVSPIDVLKVSNDDIILDIKEM